MLEEFGTTRGICDCLLLLTYSVAESLEGTTKKILPRFGFGRKSARLFFPKIGHSCFH